MESSIDVISLSSSPILVGFQWKYIFNDNIGLLNNFLYLFGYESAIPWLIDKYLAMGSIMVAEKELITKKQFFLSVSLLLS